MFRNIFLTLLLSCLAACSTTQELKEARRDNNERLVSYSALTGESYRLLPRVGLDAEQARAMPKNSAYSYSPITGQSTLIQTQPGRKGKISLRKSPNQPDQVVSYSPLWGEALVVPRDGKDKN